METQIHADALQYDVYHDSTGDENVMPSQQAQNQGNQTLASDSKPDRIMTLEERVNQARKRAEMFSSTLNEARKKEHDNLKLEDDKKQLNHAYTSKSLELDQVERELTHTVTSLYNERSKNNNSYHPMSSSDQKPSNVSMLDHIPQQGRLNLDQNIPPFNIVDKSNSHTVADSRSYRDLFSDASTTSNVGNNIREAPSQHRENVFALLQRSQQENKKLQLEIVGKRSEYEKLSREYQDISHKVDTLTSDKNSLTNALRDAEIRLDMRLKQVVALNEEAEKKSIVEKELKDKIKVLESQVALQKSELSMSSSDLRTAMSRIFLLEKELENNKNDSIVTAQNEKLKSLEDLSSQLKSRLDSLESSHKIELSQLESRYNSVSNDLIDEQAKRQALQVNYEILLRNNSDLTTEKQNLTESKQQLEAKLTELQRIIPILVSGREPSRGRETDHIDSHSPLISSNEIAVMKSDQNVKPKEDKVNIQSMNSRKNMDDFNLSQSSTATSPSGVVNKVSFSSTPSFHTYPPKSLDISVDTIDHTSNLVGSIVDIPKKDISLYGNRNTSPGGRRTPAENMSEEYDDVMSLNKKAYLLRLQEAQQQLERSIESLNKIAIGSESFRAEDSSDGFFKDHRNNKDKKGKASSRKSTLSNAPLNTTKNINKGNNRGVIRRDIHNQSRYTPNGSMLQRSTSPKMAAHNLSRDKSTRSYQGSQNLLSPSRPSVVGMRIQNSPIPLRGNQPSLTQSLSKGKRVINMVIPRVSDPSNLSYTNDSMNLSFLSHSSRYQNNYPADDSRRSFTSDSRDFNSSKAFPGGQISSRGRRSISPKFVHRNRSQSVPMRRRPLS